MWTFVGEGIVDLVGVVGCSGAGGDGNKTFRMAAGGCVGEMDLRRSDANFDGDGIFDGFGGNSKRINTSLKFPFLLPLQ